MYVATSQVCNTQLFPYDFHQAIRFLFDEFCESDQVHSRSECFFNAARNCRRFVRVSRFLDAVVFQGIFVIGLWRGNLLFLVERWIVSFLFVDFLVQSIKSSPDNWHKLVFPTFATYVASSGLVKQDPTLDQPHLSQAWQALSSGDGLPDQIGLETYIYDEVGEWKAHKWDYA